MKHKGISFTQALIPAVMDETKTVTRRAMNPQPPEWVTTLGYTCFTPKGKISGRGNYEDQGPAEKFLKGPRYQAGEVCYVQEALERIGDSWPSWHISYRADGHVPLASECIATPIGWPWKPRVLSSRFMPRRLARTWVKILDVRAERVQDITEADAIAEGSQIPCSQLPKSCQQATLTERCQFSRIWDSINAKRGYPWADNPWVWRYLFELTEVPE